MAVEPFLTQLADLCRTHRTPAKWVFVPSHAAGHTLAERLALEGTSWVNLRFVPPLDLALQMAAPFLVEQEIDPAPDTLGPALLMRLLLELPTSTPRYFGPLAEHPKMADALWTTVRELRLAGVRAVDLSRAAFASAEKQAELAALLAAYEGHLAVRRLADPAAVYEEALQHLDHCPILPGDVRMELPGVIWAPLERQFLHALPGRRLTPATLHLPGVAPPRRLALLAAPQAAVQPAPISDAERLSFLLAPAKAPSPKQDGTLSLFRAGGKEAEVEEVLRRIQADRMPLTRWRSPAPVRITPSSSGRKPSATTGRSPSVLGSPSPSRARRGPSWPSARGLPGDFRPAASAACSSRAMSGWRSQAAPRPVRRHASWRDRRPHGAARHTPPP